MALTSLHRHVIPESDRSPVSTLLETLAGVQQGDHVQIVIVGHSGRRERVELPGSMMPALTELAALFAKKGAAMLMDDERELSPEEAAGMLGMSRPMFMHRVRQGAIPFKMVGTHHRILISDVEAFLSRERAEQESLLEFGEQTDELTSSHGI